ncbi:unnamed protein product [Thelazia callipaeda]|uniref:Uncharacterized protein n=1 Tax=Thelazia callipaeda TaxID=103827 RepID=A0A0N5D8L5_THECL|nr:unnamed protein product [Thelazia callipaeda]
MGNSKMRKDDDNQYNEYLEEFVLDAKVCDTKVCDLKPNLKR